MQSILRVARERQSWSASCQQFLEEQVWERRFSENWSTFLCSLWGREGEGGGDGHSQRLLREGGGIKEEGGGRGTDIHKDCSGERGDGEEGGGMDIHKDCSGERGDGEGGREEGGGTDIHKDCSRAKGEGEGRIFTKIAPGGGGGTDIHKDCLYNPKSTDVGTYVCSTAPCTDTHTCIAHAHT